MRVGIVGAGVIGLSIGYELVSQGHEVSIFDSDAAGGAASASNAGWITPFLSRPRAAPGAVGDALRSLLTKDAPATFNLHPEIGFASWGTRFLISSSRRRSSRVTAALQELATRAIPQFDSLLHRGVEFEHHKEGLAVVFHDEGNLNQYARHADGMRRQGYVGTTRVLRGASVQEFDPAISRNAAGVVHLEDERHVRPESLNAGLAKAFTDLGGELVQHRRIRGLEQVSGGWSLVTVTDRHHVDRVVVAAGFSSGSLLRPLGIRVPLEAAKGVSLTARGEGLAPKHPMKLFERMVACSPFEGGSVRLSGTFDVGDRTRSVSGDRLEMVVRHGLEYLENWRPTSPQVELAGHRPTTADDAPLIGAVSGRTGLYLATGHGTLGITLGPVTGALAAREISEGTDEPLLRPFRPARFRKLG